MKTCTQLYTSLNLEYGYLTPCCSFYAPKIPIFPVASVDGQVIRDYASYIRQVEMDLQNEDSLLCRGCKNLEESDHAPPSGLALTSVSINTNRHICNIRCSYCNYWKSPKKERYSALQAFAALRDEGALAEGCWFGFAGGEPVLLEDFETLVRWVTGHGYLSRFITNCSIYSPVIQEAIDNHGARILTSLDAGTPETFLAIKGKDYFHRTVENIQRYNRKRNAVTVKYILLDRNMDLAEIDAFLRVCSESGVDKVILSLSRPIFRFSPSRLYRAAAYFVNRCRESGLECLDEDTSNHPEKINRALDSLLLDGVYDLQSLSRFSWSLWSGFQDDMDHFTFPVSTQEGLREARDRAESFEPDFSLRNWPVTYFFPLQGNDEGALRKRAELVRLAPLLDQRDHNVENMAPDALNRLFWTRLREKHREYLQAQAERLQGKAVYFWGYGEAYRKLSYLFAGCAPKAILVNYSADARLPESVDGIPVKRDREEQLDGSVPVIAFARDSSMKWIVHYLEARYPDLVRNNLVLCRLLEDNDPHRRIASTA